MWQLFTSSSVHKVDGKGRVSVPALFRRVLEQGETPGTVILIPNLFGSGCIEGFTQEYIDRIARRISKLPPFTQKRRQLERAFLANAIPMQLDETGRIVLSAQLKKAAGIGDTAKFVGMGESFQIWAPEQAGDDGDGDAPVDPEALMNDLGWDDGDEA
jgi:MraZ protein